jgi:hypothetical protein
MIQSMPGPWRRNPKPDVAVTSLTDRAREAAHAGQVRLIGVVTINPMLEVEFTYAGELDDVKKNLLIAGLTRLIQQVSE